MKLFKVSCFLLLGLLCTACQEEDFGFSSDEVFRGAYTRSFIEKIGEISPNQSWDFSKYGRQKSGATRAYEEYVSVKSSDGYYYVDNTTLTWMKGQLTEGQDHRSIVRSFNFSWDKGSVFEIIPIFQGQAGLTWDLYLRLGDDEYKLWSKSQGLERKEKSTNCSNCNGTGHLDSPTCPDCNGSGIYSYTCNNIYSIGIWDSNINKHVERCSKDDEGAYYCPVKGNQESGCYLCGKSHKGNEERGYIRICPHCNGTNTIYCSTCDGTGHYGESPLCEACNGTGKTEWIRLSDITDDTNKQRTDLASVTAVRAIPVDSRNFIKKDYPDGTKMTFYLKITSSGNSYAAKDTEQSSDGGKICLLDCDTPSNIPSRYTSYILGCEDATNSCDNDYNDVCFLVTGIVPKVIYEDAEEVETISKRYMIEDLTNVGDFDFNDIVVDVIQKKTTYYKVNTETKVYTLDDTKAPKIEQEATVRWLCGTVPIQVKVGDYTFGKVTAPVEQAQSAAQLMGCFNGTPKENSSNTTNGYQPIYEGKSVTKTITGWDPDQNNIAVYVWWNGSEVINTGTSTNWINTFPNRNGSVPTMIATDIDDVWPAEGAFVTETDWWKQNYISNQ